MSEATLVASLDAPTAGAFTFTGLTLTGYRHVTLELIDIAVTTDGTDVRLTHYTGAAEVTSGYDWYVNGQSSGNTANPDSAAGAASMLLCSNDANWDTGNGAAKSFSATVEVDDPGSSGNRKMQRFQSHSIGPTGNMVSNHGGGMSATTGALDGFKVGGTSNLVSGRVRIWGNA